MSAPGAEHTRWLNRWPLILIGLASTRMSGRAGWGTFAIIPVDVAIEDALAKLNQALADAEVMRLPKALVKPN